MSIKFGKMAVKTKVVVVKAYYKLKALVLVKFLVWRFEYLGEHALNITGKFQDLAIPEIQCICQVAK